MWVRLSSRSQSEECAFSASHQQMRRKLRFQTNLTFSEAPSPGELGILVMITEDQVAGGEGTCWWSSKGTPSAISWLHCWCVQRTVPTVLSEVVPTIADGRSLVMPTTTDDDQCSVATTTDDLSVPCRRSRTTAAFLGDGHGWWSVYHADDHRWRQTFRADNHWWLCLNVQGKWRTTAWTNLVAYNACGRVTGLWLRVGELQTNFALCQLIIFVLCRFFEPPWWSSSTPATVSTRRAVSCTAAMFCRRMSTPWWRRSKRSVWPSTTGRSWDSASQCGLVHNRDGHLGAEQHSHVRTLCLNSRISQSWCTERQRSTVGHRN